MKDKQTKRLLQFNLNNFFFSLIYFLRFFSFHVIFVKFMLVKTEELITFHGEIKNHDHLHIKQFIKKQKRKKMKQKKTTNYIKVYKQTKTVCNF